MTRDGGGPSFGLSAVQLAQLRGRLALAVSGFEDDVGSAAEAASLVQVWLPERDPHGVLLLHTKGLPYCVSGQGDLLALFRCISCRYNFSTTTAAPDLLGAPGRVFATGEPEFLSNVQQCSSAVYMRSQEAAQCHVQSVLLLPMFGERGRLAPIGVLEIARSTRSTPARNVVHALASAIEACGLYLCDAEGLQKEMDIAVIMNLSALKLCCKEAADSACPSQPGSATDLVTAAAATPTGGATAAAAAEPDGHPSWGLYGGMPPDHGGPSDTLQLAGDGDGDEHMVRSDEGGSPKDGDASNDEAPSGMRRRGGFGTTGKPGRKLRLEDLQEQFGVSLQEAALKLGICATTLKRACRRHGIQRWPRRPGGQRVSASSHTSAGATTFQGWSPAGWGSSGQCRASAAPVFGDQFFGASGGSALGASVSQPVSVPVGGSTHSVSALPQFFGHGSAGTGGRSFQSLGDASVRGGFLCGSASTGSHGAGFGDVAVTQSQVLGPPALPRPDSSVQLGMPPVPQMTPEQHAELRADQQQLLQLQQQQLQSLQEQHYHRWWTQAQQQAATLAAQQQQQQQCASERLAVLEVERAALLTHLDAQKAQHGEGLTREQLKAQHNERWWGAKQAQKPHSEQRGEAEPQLHLGAARAADQPAVSILTLQPPSIPPAEQELDADGFPVEGATEQDLAFSVDHLFFDGAFDDVAFDAEDEGFMGCDALNLSFDGLGDVQR